ncbi:hypothetical protein HUO09_17285 [Vibrio sp. Y2-5]|uniref:hypothetical protein n=1 Tax=Vibrio sp. Y2-5 TaxID=2743977 RepID=UPI0016614A09|nr:hypothetical protein [Vibrio sp. Y2-5]MBD0788110.1 hypothetical protein [Vibrio sp. Y2-5]
MASIETLEKVVVRQLNAQFNYQARYDGLKMFFAISLCVAVFIATAWYLFFGPAFMDLWPPMHQFMVLSINSIPAPETNHKLYEILLDQGYVSVVQMKELSDMAALEVDKLLSSQQ